MKTLVKHRVNRIAELREMNPAWGAEIDLRSVVGEAGRLHLSHDAWSRGDDFETWLKLFRERDVKGPLILNTKEDGLEERVIELLKKYSVVNYFFLDTALPTLVKWTAKGSSDFAVRLSQYEPEAFCRKFEGRVKWVWVDCFEGRLLEAKMVSALRGKFKLCLVSPELQGKPFEKSAPFLELLALCEAVCTKYPEKL